MLLSALSTFLGRTILTVMDFFFILLKATFWAAAIAFTLLVVSILTILAMAKLHQTRALKTLAGLMCPSCGKPFGRAAATAAHEFYIAKCEEFQREHPGIRFRHLEVWTIHCPHCGTTAEFMSNTLKLVSALP
jgi:endogenous inhibitor of DNA gyrase (YacG/DUF329 family)